MRVNRTEFLEILSRVEPGLSKRDLVEQSRCFVFKQGWVSTFNDEICCQTKTGLPDDFEGAVYAEKLKQVIENMDDAEIEIRVKEGGVSVRGNRKEAEVRREAKIILPVDQVEIPQKGEWKELPEGFGEALKLVIDSAGTNDEEFITVCVNIHPDWLEACDRKQATRYFMKAGVTRPFLVRASSLKHTIPLGMTKIGETDNWVHFRNKLVIFSCRRHLDEYQSGSITKMMEFRGEKFVLPRGGVEGAKLASVFTSDDKDNDKALVTMADGRFTVRGDGSMGWASVDLDTDYKGVPLTFRIPPQLLISLVTKYKDCEISDTRLMVTGENWKYLTVLGKVEDKKSASEN